jgi:FG-GAP repeat
LGAAGSAYVFVRTGEVWNQQQKVLAADAAPNDRFGFSVAISGELVVIGAPFADGVSTFDQGAVYVFARSGEVWSQREKLEASSDGELLDQFGDSVAISGEAVVVGAPTDDDAAGSDQGSTYVFGL